MSNLARPLLWNPVMPKAARSLLVLLMSTTACFRVGEPLSGSAAPEAVEVVEAASAEEPATELARLQSELAVEQAEAAADEPVEIPSVVAESAEALPVEPARPVIDTVEVLVHTTVRAEPRRDAPALGMVSMGGRVDVHERFRAPGCRGKWLAIAPRGFVCTKTRATRRSAHGILPVVPDYAGVPGVYGSVAKEALVYGSLDAAAAQQEGRAPGRHLTVRREKSAAVEGKSFWKTRYGWVRGDDVRRLKGTRFHGEMVEDGLAQPLAWTLPAPDQKGVDVLAEPTADAEVLTRLPARRPRSVLAERDGFVQVEEGWIALERVRVARRAEAPSGVGDERWIDVDLSQQVLVAYEGVTPVYATLISSGRPGHRTPTGVFRISRKVAERTMNSMADSSDSYSVDKVPWTAYFAHGYALHAAFWHGGFGRTRSHGCVNLAPRDARALYDWMSPLAAPGWSEVYGHEDQLGSVVRLRNDRDPEPEWKGYAKELMDADADAVQVAHAG